MDGHASCGRMGLRRPPALMMAQDGGDLRRSNHVSNTVITHLAAPACKQATEATLGFLSLPFQLFEKHFGSADFPLDFPFATLSFTVLPDSLATLPVIPTAATIIMSSDQLVDRRILEQVSQSTFLSTQQHAAPEGRRAHQVQILPKRRCTLLPHPARGLSPACASWRQWRRSGLASSWWQRARATSG